MLFVVRECNLLYFDDHFHSYVVELTANKSVMYEKYVNNVYHAHRINDKLHDIVSLKHYFCELCHIYKDIATPLVLCSFNIVVRILL